MLKHGCTLEQLTDAVVLPFPPEVYPLKLTNAMFETSHLRRPGVRPIVAGILVDRRSDPRSFNVEVLEADVLDDAPGCM